MEYRVEELAAAAGVRVDTIRFYQGRGLIEAPSKAGRIALYSDTHLERIKQIRSLLEQGFSLAQIARISDEGTPTAQGDEKDAAAPERALLDALVSESVGSKTFDAAEFARETGLPEALLTSVRRSGLLSPIEVDGEERFTASDVELARAGLLLLEAGIPLGELLAVADSHVRNTQQLADAGIDLFDDHIRKAAQSSEQGATGESSGPGETITDAFQKLLPHVTRLVALHFQRTLVNRALERLRRAGDDEALEQALAATESGRLEIEWR